jgi:hypothetical protein
LKTRPLASAHVNIRNNVVAQRITPMQWNLPQYLLRVKFIIFANLTRKKARRERLRQ